MVDYVAMILCKVEVTISVEIALFISVDCAFLSTQVAFVLYKYIYADLLINWIWKMSNDIMLY